MAPDDGRVGVTHARLIDELGDRLPGLAIASRTVGSAQIRNRGTVGVLYASFTDYLIPTTLDMPRVVMDVLEHADPVAPYGLKSVGEPPNISTPPAVRAASGVELARIPVRPGRGRARERCTAVGSEGSCGVDGLMRRQRRIGA